MLNGKSLKQKKKTKKKHHNQILHIQYRLGTKFQLQLTVLNFWTKLTQSRSFQSKKINKKQQKQQQKTNKKTKLPMQFSIFIFNLV